MSNIIQFPTKEELKKSDIFDELTNEQKEESLKDFASQLTGEIISILNDHGYWLDEEKDTAAVSMVMDSIHSLLLNVENIEHPFQGIAQMMYDPENAGTEMTVILSEIED